MSRSTLTTTSYAVLGLLSIKSWSSYELTQQMDRSLGRMWPRATSKLYEEPKKLVEHGFAKVSDESIGRRPRSVYTITPRGRRALAAWLGEPSAGPVLEYEQLLKVFFAESGSKADLLATLGAAATWAEAQLAESAAVGEAYLAGDGPFPERLPILALSSRFLTDFYALVHQWAEWSAGVVATWPENPADAPYDESLHRETLARARRLTPGVRRVKT